MSFRLKKALRAVSFVLVCSLLAEHISYALPEKRVVGGGSWMVDREKGEKLLGFDLPPSIATVEDSYFSSPTTHNPPPTTLVFLLQDPHANFSGQLNLSKVLDILLQRNPAHYVFLEGGSGNESLSFLRKYAPKDKREQIAKQFLRQGKLQGSEYLDLTSNHNTLLYGVEDLSLYFQSLKAYQEVTKKRDKSFRYLERIEQTIKTLKPRLYNPSLLFLDEKRTKYEKNDLSLAQYLEILKTQSPKASSFFNLKLLNKLKKLEDSTHWKNASPKQRHTRLYSHLSKKLNLKALLKELKLLEDQTFKSLLHTKDEETLYNLDKLISLLKKLLNLSLTPEEYEEYQREKRIVDSGSWVVDKEKPTTHHPQPNTHDPSFLLSLTGFL
ncbi:MAG: hypothetical protein HY593_05200, partial [Candidatus Omnitrophica bacterium]|nr:hypothetical protein [Candidatus Omnitrophota bacterium]